MKYASSIASEALLVSALFGCVLFGCNKPSATAQQSAQQPAQESAQQTAQSTAALKAAPAAAAPSSAQAAQVGQPAPDFSLPDLDGKMVSLSQFRGKPVVLEWFNPGCPFVRASHTAGSLKGYAAKEEAQGVVWLAINSAGPGKQGHGPEATRKAQTEYGMNYPVLLDETGKVGHLYGAERTPQMYVIDAKGVLVYRGAIDNSPDGEGQSPQGGKLVNYVASALGAVRSGAQVEPAETKPYGCGVKYID